MHATNSPFRVNAGIEAGENHIGRAERLRRATRVAQYGLGAFDMRIGNALGKMCRQWPRI